MRYLGWRIHRLQLVLGRPYSPRTVRDCRHFVWFDVDQGHLFLSRASEKDQLVVFGYHREPILRTNGCLIHPLAKTLGMVLLGTHSFEWCLHHLDLSKWSLSVRSTSRSHYQLALFGLLQHSLYPGTLIVLTSCEQVFLDESFYNRDLANPRPYKGSRWQRMIGYEQWRNRKTRGSLVQCAMRPVIAISRIPLFALIVYYFLNFAWVIGKSGWFGYVLPHATY